MKLHHVFRVSLLEPYKESAIPGRIQQPLPCIEVENHIEYEVEKILDSRRRWGQLEYFVHWLDYDINERTWEPAENLANVPQMVQEFNRQYPPKPRPH